MLLGRAYQQAGRYDAFEGLGMLNMVLAMQSPRDEVSQRHLDLLQQGHERQGVGDWDGALAAYHQALEGEPEPGREFHVRRYLGALHALHGRYREALEEAERRAAAARASEMDTLVAMALVTQGRYLLRLDDPQRALDCSEQALAAAPEIDHVMRSQGLTLRARCRARQEQFAAGQEDLDNVWQLLAPAQDCRFLRGVQHSLVYWWAAAAELRAARGDIGDSIGAWRCAIERCREVQNQCLLAELLHDLGQALVLTQDLGAAEEAFAESRTLRRLNHLPPLDV
jgi:tetratricopeptide (TPR) repeat protein